MPNRPILFFDTSVCIEVARRNVPNSKWAAAWRRILADYRYRISPLTAYELIAGLATGDEAKFDQNREALRVVFPARQKKVLPDLRTFIAKQVFNENLVSPSHLPNTDLWIRTVLRAPTKRALESGSVPVGQTHRHFGLDLSNINQQLRDYENQYVSRFRDFQRLQVPQLTPDVWANLILKSYRKETTLTNRLLVLEKLDAAYRFDVTIWVHAQHPKYNLDKHKTELVDAQQLYYLCNSDVHFLTADSRLRNRVLSSSQIDRILTLDGFLGSS
jgi:predicted nucleic acid-binding protein